MYRQYMRHNKHPYLFPITKQSYLYAHVPSASQSNAVNRRYKHNRQRGSDLY